MSKFPSVNYLNLLISTTNQNKVNEKYLFFEFKHMLLQIH